MNACGPRVGAGTSARLIRRHPPHHTLYSAQESIWNQVHGGEGHQGRDSLNYPVVIHKQLADLASIHEQRDCCYSLEPQPHGQAQVPCSRQLFNYVATVSKLSSFGLEDLGL